MSRGRLIVFEGPDGAGKSSQIELVKNYLEAATGLVVGTSRQPGGSKLGEDLRNLIKRGDHKSPRALELMFAAARAEGAEALTDDLERFDVVLCDRWQPISNHCYAEAAGCDRSFTTALNSLLLPHDPTIDLVVLFDIPAHVAWGRTDHEDLCDSDAERWRAVNQSYRQLVESSASGWCYVSGHTYPVAVVEAWWDDAAVRDGIIDAINDRLYAKIPTLADCACGHPSRQHHLKTTLNGGSFGARRYECLSGNCTCQEFRPALGWLG